MSNWLFSARGVWRALGPGLVTGGADDDPSGIATYSQAGAQFGYSLLWTAVINGVVAVPIMVATMLVISGKRAARKMAIPRWLLILGWLAAGLMVLAVVLLIWSSV